MLRGQNESAAAIQSRLSGPVASLRKKKIRIYRHLSLGMKRAADVDESMPKKPKTVIDAPVYVKRHWLLKSEPDTFSLEHLIAAPNSTAPWDGVRNLEARQALRSMKEGDRAFFYYSSCKEPAVVGEIEIVRENYPDPTQFDKSHTYYDMHSKKESPKWSAVDVKYVRKLKRRVTLKELQKDQADLLADFRLLTRKRLSVIPVEDKHWEHILALENK